MSTTPCRSFLRAGLTALAVLAGLPALRAAEVRPNVLFIIADDMNDYGFHGQFPGVKMPHLEAFKQTAVTFRRAYCAAPACVPSRAAFFSGLNPNRTGAYLNGSGPWTKAPMQAVDSLPEMFKQSGYETWGAGKLFHVPISKARAVRAWDNRPYGGGFGPFLKPADQLAGKWWGAGPWTGPDTDFPDVRNTAAAIEFLRRPHDRPFFLALGLWRPHTPFTAPKRFFDLYDEAKVPMPPAGWREGDLDDVPAEAKRLAAVWGQRWVATGQDHPDLWRRIVWAYLACNSFADWSVGRVIEALDASPFADHTLVVFFGDNGYHDGEKNHFEKSTLWEQAAGVPLAIRLPGRSNAGRLCPAPVSLVDLFPTLADYCALKAPRQRLDGFSLRPLLEHPATALAPRPAFTSCGEHEASLRDPHFRYIRYPDGSEELYDALADPHEWHNLAADPAYEAVRMRFRKLLPHDFAPSLGGRDG